MTNVSGAVDSVQLRALLTAYWRMSGRGATARALAARGGREAGHALLIACLLYGLLGAVTGAVLVGSGVLLFGFVLHAFTLVVVGMALTVESGDVLFSRVESEVLGPRPVTPATLLLGKTLHLYAFGLVLALSVNAVPIVLAAWVKGARPWFFLAHLLAVALQMAFTCAAVVFVYGVVARLVGRQRFETVATWAQVGMSVVFVLGMQLAPQVVSRFEGAALPSAVLSFTPPGWFAALGASLGGAGSSALLLPAATGVGATVVLAWYAVRKLSAGYSDRLSALGETTVFRSRPARIRTARRSGALVRLWLADPVERAAFSLASAYMARDRETKQRLYPSLAGLLVVPLMSLAGSRKGPFGATFFGLFGMGMAGLLAVSVVEILRVSSRTEAADLFAVAPLATTAGLFHGTRKAALAWATLPSVLAMAALVLFLFPGGAESLLAAIPLVLAIPTLSLVSGLAGDYRPLASAVVRGEVGGQATSLAFGGMLVMTALAAVGYFSFRSGFLLPVIAVELPLLAALHALALRSIRSRPFPEV